MIIYIAGRGHSGSTILDILLSQSNDIHSSGQIAAGLSREATGSTCSCGEKTTACEFWVNVKNEYEKSQQMDWNTMAEKSGKQAIFSSFPATFFSILLNGKLRELGSANNNLYNAISKVSNRSRVLDSSKSTPRALLTLDTNELAKIVHLVRDPRQVILSHYWRFRNWNGHFTTMRRTFKLHRSFIPLIIVFTSVSWMIGNLILEAFKIFYSYRIYRVRYEDLCNDTEKTLTELATWLNISIEEVVGLVHDKQPMKIGHYIGGNRIRMQKEIVFDPTLSKQSDTRQYPKWLFPVVTLICWPLMLLYQYKLSEVSR